MNKIAASIFTLILILSACSTPVSAPPEADERVELEGLSVNSASAKLAPRTKAASSALKANIEEFSGSKLVIEGKRTPPRRGGQPSSLKMPQNLKVGDILISEPVPEAPKGIFVRITGIKQDGSNMRYDTVPASLGEAFVDLDFDMVKEMNASELKSVTGPQGLGGSAMLNTQATFVDIDESFDDYVICDGDNKEKTTDDQITVSGSFKANVSTFADIDVDSSLLKHFELGVEVDESVNLDIKGKCGETFAEEKPIRRYEFTSFPVPILDSFISLSFTPYVELFIGADGGIYAEVDIKAEQSFEGRYGVQYERGDGWDGIKESKQVSPTVDVKTFQGTAKARAYVGAKAGVEFFEIAEAYGSPKAFVEAKASVTEVSNPVVDYCLSAGLSFAVGANLELKIRVLGITLVKIKEDWDEDFGDIIKKEILCKQEPYIAPDIPEPTKKATLTVRQFMPGSVSVSAPGVKRRCYSNCTVEIEQGARVILSTGNANTLWWGDCTANKRSSCALTMSSDKRVNVEVLGPPGGPLY